MCPLLVNSLHVNLIFVNSSGRFDFCLTVHHQLGKVIQMNQLDATMIYWSIKSAQHVSGNILPIIRSVRLRFLQHMVSCCGGQGDGEWQSATLPLIFSLATIIARNMLSWSYRSINHCCKSLLHLVGSSVLLYLVEEFIIVLIYFYFTWFWSWFVCCVNSIRCI